MRLDLLTTAPVIDDVRPGLLTLSSEHTQVEITLESAGRALLRVDGGPVSMRFSTASQYDAVVQENDHVWRYIDSGANRNYRIRVDGSAELTAQWDGLRNHEAVLTVSPENGRVLLVIDEFGSTAPSALEVGFDAVAAAAEADFGGWLAKHAPPPRGDGPSQTARLAAFVTWAALVPAGGLLRRESMLMSKNGMTNIWSWDHCFNALALWRDPVAAADQLLTLFDHQDEYGCLPDYVNDAGLERNFVKPPVHGWAIGWLLDRGGLTDDVTADLYGPLVRWTEWWFAHRDYGGDGIPSYNHGNDSGWDNSTAFAAGVPLQTPELLAYLALQMRTLARIARQLGRDAESADWVRRSEHTVTIMIDRFWVDGRFVARKTVTGESVRSGSLLMLMPLTLGELLPAVQFAACVRHLVEDAFLTPYGPASESTSSPEYKSDGYWRGPVWAPTVMLLVDGLARGGAVDLADDLRKRFLQTCVKGGMAENFDALTGEGLRDRSLTWTASVYLALEHQSFGAPAS